MSGDQRAFEKAMNSGHSAAWDQHWNEAAEFYRQALEQFPSHPMALNSLGLVMYEMREFEKALRCYQRAAQVAPDDPMPVEKTAQVYEKLEKTKESIKAYVDAAELHLKTRNAEKAIESWKHALCLQPDNLSVRARLAMIFERMGRKREAVMEYIATASLLQKAGQRGKAVQVVEFALNLIPANDEARQVLAMLNTNQRLPAPPKPVMGDTKPIKVGTASDSDNRKELDPAGEARQKALTELAGLVFDQAEETLAQPETGRKGLANLTRGTGPLNRDQNGRTRILLHLGQAIESQTNGQDNQAAEELERAVEAGLNHPAANFDLGLLRTERSPQKAMRYLQKSVNHPDFALASYLLMAQIYHKEQKYSEAALHYLQALRLADVTTVAPEFSNELLQLYEPILEAQTKKDDPKLLNDLCANIAGQLHRSDWRVYLQTARTQLPGSEGEVPLPLAEMLMESNSSQVVNAVARIRVLMEQKHYRAAMEEAYYTLQYAPTYLPLHVQIGDILLREGSTQEAVAKFMIVAELYGLRGEANQALLLLQRVVSMAPMELNVRRRLIDLLTSQGKIDEALQQYWDLANMYYHLSELSQARQTYSAALRLAQQSRADHGWSVQILYKIADIDMQCLDWRQAVRVFEQIRTLEPEDETARVTLIDLNFRLGNDASAFSEADSFTALFEHSGRRPAAIQFLDKIIKDHPEKLELLKRLADLYIRSGQTAPAVECLDKIADALLSAGNRDGAMAMLKAIIALKPVNIEEYQTALLQVKAGN